MAGAGICCVDYIVVSPQVHWGDTVEVSDYIVQGGGLVGTAMVACARLGAKCELLSLVGDDNAGKEIIAGLVSEGVPSDGIQTVEDGKSPFSFIHVDADDGERTIFHRQAAGLGFDPARFSTEAAANWGVLLVDGYYPDLSVFAARAARENGVPVVADLIPGEENAELLKLVDVLIAPRHYARQIGCEINLDLAFEAIHKLGPTTALITLGADGWIFFGPERAR